MIKSTDFLQQTAKAFPNIFIRNPDDNLSVYLSAIKSGSLPITISYKDEIIELSRISIESIQMMNRLIQMYDCILVTGEDEYIELNNIFDFIENIV